MCSNCDKLNAILDILEGSNLEDMVTITERAFAIALGEIGAQMGIVQAMPRRESQTPGETHFPESAFKH